MNRREMLAVGIGYLGGYLGGGMLPQPSPKSQEEIVVDIDLGGESGQLVAPDSLTLTKEDTVKLIRYETVGTKFRLYLSIGKP